MGLVDLENRLSASVRAGCADEIGDLGVKLADRYEDLGRVQDAEGVLRAAIEHLPLDAVKKRRREDSSTTWASIWPGFKGDIGKRSRRWSRLRSFSVVRGIESDRSSL